MASLVNWVMSLRGGTRNTGTPATPFPKHPLLDDLKSRVSELDQAFLTPGAVHYKTSGAPEHPVQWLFGSETEFELFSDRKDKKAEAKLLDELKGEIKREILGGALSSSTEMAADQLAAQVDAFDVKDCIMYKIYEELKEDVEFRFGKAKFGFGFYDNEGVAEVRIKPCPPSQLLNTYVRLNDAVRSISQKFGYHAVIQPTHLSGSANILNGGNAGNLMELESGMAEDFKHHALAGISSVRASSSPIFSDTNIVDVGPTSFSAGVDRLSDLRLCKSRFEDRSAGAGDVGMLAKHMIAMMGGAKVGLEKNAQDIEQIQDFKLQKVQHIAVNDPSITADSTDGNALHTRDIINASIINADGSLSNKRANRKAMKEWFGDGADSLTDAQIAVLQSLVLSGIKVLDDGAIDTTNLNENRRAIITTSFPSLENITFDNVKEKVTSLKSDGRFKSYFLLSEPVMCHPSTMAATVDALKQNEDFIHCFGQNLAERLLDHEHKYRNQRFMVENFRRHIIEAGKSAENLQNPNFKNVFINLLEDLLKKSTPDLPPAEAARILFKGGVLETFDGVITASQSEGNTESQPHIARENARKIDSMKDNLTHINYFLHALSASNDIPHAKMGAEQYMKDVKASERAA